MFIARFIRLVATLTLILFSTATFCQIKAEAKGTFEIETYKIWGIDKFETVFHSSENQTFFKTTVDTTITYANFQLGQISNVNTFNPLKINLFYQDFNTVIILDNRLAEIQRIDFNTVQPYRNVTFMSTGYDNTIWIYNQDLQILELYDYRTNTSRIKTVPIIDEILDIKSDYNNCYLLTDKYLYVYSYFGNLETKHPNTGFNKMAFSEANLVLQGEEQYFFYIKKRNEILPIENLNLLINDFLVTNETLYLYRDNLLYRYQLNTN